jgi:hypothetical protein
MKPYFEHVDIENLSEISRGILELLPLEEYDKTFSKFYDANIFKNVPGLVEVIEKFGPYDQVDSVYVIYQDPSGFIPLHTDGNSVEDGRGVVLNIPLQACEHCFTRVYRDKSLTQSDSEMLDLPNYLVQEEAPHKVFKLSDLELVAEICNKDQAMLLNTLEPHTSVNNGTRTLVLASFWFKPLLLW